MILINPYSFGNKWDNARVKAIASLTSAGYFARMDKLFIPKGAVDVSAAVLDWKGGSSASIHGSASWSAAYGFVGSAVSGSYINTNFTPSTDGINFASTSASMGCYVTALPTNVSGVQYYAGGYAGGEVSKIVSIYQQYSSGAFESRVQVNNNTAIVGGVYPVAAGMLVAVRSGTNVTLYRDGVAKNSYTLASGGLTAAPIDICAQCANGNHGNGGSDVKVGAWWVGDEFSVAEQNSIKSIIDTYYADVA